MKKQKFKIAADGLQVGEPDFFQQVVGDNPFKGEAPPKLTVPTQDGTANLNMQNYDKIKQFVGIMPEAKSSDLFQSYITHQQGKQGYKELMSGKISPSLLKRLNANVPSKFKSDDPTKIVENFKKYWTDKLSAPVTKAFDPKVKEAITKAATEAGEDPNKWLKFAEVESNAGKNLHRDGSKYHGFFQIDQGYVKDKQDLYDPYKSTKAAIALANQKWGKDKKLVYEQGGKIPPMFNNVYDKLVYGDGGLNQNPPKVYTNATEYNKAANNYNDSLALYNYTQLQKKLEGVNPSHHNKNAFEKFAMTITGGDTFNHGYMNDSRFENGKQMSLNQLNNKNLSNDRLKAIKEIYNRQPNSIKQKIPLDDYIKRQNILFNATDNLVKTHPNIAYDNFSHSPDVVHKDIVPQKSYWGFAENYDYSNAYPKQPVKYQPPVVNTTKGTVTGTKVAYSPDKKNVAVINSKLVPKNNHPITKMQVLNPVNIGMANSQVYMQGQPINLPKAQLPQQHGKPIYGPGSTIIGYSDEQMNFKPAYQYTGAPNNEYNLQDKELMNNPEALKKYIMSKDSGYKIMAMGGMTQNLYKANEGNVMLEADEHVKLPTGQSFEVTGDKHSDPSGGELMSLPGGTKVYSEKEKASKELASTLLGRVVKKPISFADLAHKYSTDDDTKLAKSKDKFDQTTAKFNLTVKNQKLDDIFLAQELTKHLKGKDNDLQSLLIEQPMDNQQTQFGDGGFINYYDKTQKKQYTAPAGLKPTDFYANENVKNYLQSQAKVKGIDGDLNNPMDNNWGARHQYAYDHFYSGQQMTPLHTQVDNGNLPKMQMNFPVQQQQSNQQQVTMNSQQPGLTYDPTPVNRANMFGMASSLASSFGRVDRPVLNPDLPNMVLPKALDVAGIQNNQVGQQIAKLSSQLETSNLPENVKQSILSNHLSEAYANLKPEAITDYTNNFNNSVTGMQNEFNQKNYAQHMMNMENYNRGNSAVNAGLESNKNVLLDNMNRYIQNDALTKTATPLSLMATGMIPTKNPDGTWNLQYDNTNNVLYEAQLKAQGFNPVESMNDPKDVQIAKLKYQLYQMQNN